MSRDLLQILRLARQHPWKCIVSLDEAWFYLSNHFDQISVPHDELSPSFQKQMIRSEKSVIMVFCDPCPKELRGQADTIRIIFFLELLLFGL
jgi:hypothetical protein